MKLFTYSLSKNIKLKLERGIGFEIALKAIRNGGYKVARIKSKNHPGQLCYIIRYNKEYWIAPFKEFKNNYHLYTMFRRD